MPPKDQDKFGDAFDALDAMARGEDVSSDAAAPKPPARKPAPSAPQPPAPAPEATQNHQNAPAERLQRPASPAPARRRPPLPSEAGAEAAAKRPAEPVAARPAVPSVGRPPAARAAARPAAQAARPAAKAAPAGKKAAKKTGKQHKAKLVQVQQKHEKSIFLMRLAIPILLVVGAMLITFLIIALQIDPPKEMTEIQEDQDTCMEMPVPTIFSQKWLRPVAWATCLPFGLGMFVLMVFMMVQVVSQSEKVRLLQEEIDALAHGG